MAPGPTRRPASDPACRGDPRLPREPARLQCQGLRGPFSFRSGDGPAPCPAFPGLPSMAGGRGNAEGPLAPEGMRACGGAAPTSATAIRHRSTWTGLGRRGAGGNGKRPAPVPGRPGAERRGRNGTARLSLPVGPDPQRDMTPGEGDARSPARRAASGHTHVVAPQVSTPRAGAPGGGSGRHSPRAGFLTGRVLGAVCRTPSPTCDTPAHRCDPRPR